MKKWLTSVFSLITATVLLSGCNQETSQKESNQSTTEKVINIAATPVPHVEILEVAKPLLAKEGIKLNIIQMTDYVRPNLALADKEVDANYFQTIPYFEAFTKERQLNFSNIANIHIEPMGMYSNKIKSLNDIKDGDQIAIPNDPSNDGRALVLLQKAGLIKLKEGVGINGTPRDIVENPKHLKIVEMNAPQLPRALNDVSLAVINTNFALEAKLDPAKDALFIEQKDSPYVNILAVRAGEENRPEIIALKKALTSDEVKQFIEQKYQGAIVPAF